MSQLADITTLVADAPVLTRTEFTSRLMKLRQTIQDDDSTLVKF